VVVSTLLHLVTPLVPYGSHPKIAAAILLVVAGGTGLAVYLVSARLLGMAELDSAVNLLLRRGRKR
jgi:hypothetical protein